jgi:hypothetical protein
MDEGGLDASWHKNVGPLMKGGQVPDWLFVAAVFGAAKLPQPAQDLPKTCAAL